MKAFERMECEKKEASDQRGKGEGVGKRILILEVGVNLRTPSYTPGGRMSPRRRKPQGPALVVLGPLNMSGLVCVKHGDRQPSLCMSGGWGVRPKSTENSHWRSIRWPARCLPSSLCRLVPP